VPTDPDHVLLADEIVALREQIAEQAAAHAAIVDRLETVIGKLVEDNRALKEKVRQLSGGSRIRLTSDANQLSIFDAPVVLDHQDSGDDPSDDDPPAGGGGGGAKGKGKSGRGARRLDTSRLPREERTIERPESERICPDTGLQLVPVGEETVHEVAYTRGSCRLIVRRLIRYGLPEDLAAERQVTEVVAEPPPRAVEGCLAHPSLLSWIIVQRFDHHLPYDRQRRILDHEGLPVTRQTLTEWAIQCGEALEPIAAQLARQIRAGPVLQIDDTPVRSLKSTNKQARFWVTANPEVAGVAFAYTLGRGADGIVPIIGQGFEGWLVGDGYSGNLRAAKLARGDVTTCGCWAHVLRKFRDAEPEGKRLSQLMVALIQKLFDVEADAEAHGLGAEQRRAMRARRSRPVLDEILRQGERCFGDLREAGALGKAWAYLQNQWTALERFLEDGRIPIHNNACELAIRPLAVGRRNWLFTGSPRGGQAAAVLMTLVSSCRLAGVDPHAYLEDVLVRFATPGGARSVADLVPARWKQLHDAEAGIPAVTAAA
jgi:transposase